MIFKGSCHPKPFHEPLEKEGGYTEAHRPPTAMFHLQWQSGSMTYVFMAVVIKIYLEDIEVMSCCLKSLQAQ